MGDHEIHHGLIKEWCVQRKRATFKQEDKNAG